MRFFFVLFFVVFSIVSFAQLTPSFIAKNKIAVITEKEFNKGSDTTITSTYYDEFGYDTAVYVNGMKAGSTAYKRNAGGKIEKHTHFNAAGNEMYKAKYTYKPDGSYVIENEDKEFGMKDYKWYDKKRSIIKSQSPDGNTITYTYNTKGQQISYKSNGVNDGVIVKVTNTYNPKGQLVKTNSTGDYRYTYTYQYDSKGLLKKTLHTTPEGSGTLTTSLFTYTFRK